MLGLICTLKTKCRKGDAVMEAKDRIIVALDVDSLDKVQTRRRKLLKKFQQFCKGGKL